MVGYNAAIYNVLVDYESNYIPIDFIMGHCLPPFHHWVHTLAEISILANHPH